MYSVLTAADPFCNTDKYMVRTGCAENIRTIWTVVYFGPSCILYSVSLFNVLQIVEGFRKFCVRAKSNVLIDAFSCKKLTKNYFLLEWVYNKWDFLKPTISRHFLIIFCALLSTQNLWDDFQQRKNISKNKLKLFVSNKSLCKLD